MGFDEFECGFIALISMQELRQTVAVFFIQLDHERNGQAVAVELSFAGGELLSQSVKCLYHVRECFA